MAESAACGQWETLLADALDGQLRVEDEATFSSHMAGCSECAAMFEEARRGQEWLSFLSAEPEVPHDLLEKILARTGPGRSPGLRPDQIALAGSAGAAPAAEQWHQPVTMSPGFIGFAQRAAATRLMMTAAMAFFSVALMLNLGGVRLENLRLNAIRPAMVRATLERRLATATVPVERYYDHLRVVHVVESSVRELRSNINGESQDEKRRQSQPGGPGVSGGAGQNHNQQDSAVNAPAINEAPLNESLPVTLATDDDFALDARNRSSIWTA
jgi:hypothetical protein